MKLNNVNELIGKVIQFNELNEVDFDTNMKARVTNVSVKEFNDGHNVVWLYVDFSEFAEENINYMKPTYWPCFSKDPNVQVYGYDNERLVRWVDTVFYPKNCKTIMYLMENEVLNLSKFSVKD